MSRFAPFFHWLGSLFKSRYVSLLESDLAVAIERAEKAELDRQAMLQTLLNHMGTPLVSLAKREPPAPGPRHFRTPSEMRRVYEAKAYEVAQKAEKPNA